MRTPKKIQHQGQLFLPRNEYGMYLYLHEIVAHPKALTEMFVAMGQFIPPAYRCRISLIYQAPNENSVDRDLRSGAIGWKYGPKKGQRSG